MRYLDLRDLANEYIRLKDRAEGERDPLDDEERKRLAALKELEDELGGNLWDYAQNEYTLIEDIDFEEYAQGFAYDVGYIGRDDDTPLTSYIDWEGWAESLKQDYTEVEFDGRTYLIRAY